MTKQLFIILGVLISLNSCKQSESKKIQASESIKTVEIRVEKNESTELTSVTESYFVNDSLTIALTSELERITENSKFEIHKEPIQNRHVDNLTDTIITRTYKNVKLISYKAASEEWVYKAKIENPEFDLNYFFTVGRDKTAVEKHIKFGIHNNILKIRNLEQTSEFILKFESGKLKMIEFKGYLD